MAKAFSKQFYQSRAWKDCRASFIAKRIATDGGYCQQCKQELGYIVHHTILLTPNNIDDIDTTLNHNNLAYLCKACHDREDNHFIKQTKKRYKFGKHGEILPLF